MEHSTKKLEVLLKASRAVMAFSSFEESAREIFDCAKEVTGAISGYVALMSESGQENEVLFLDAGGLPCTVDPELPMPIRGLRAEAYAKNKAVYENDFMHSPWIKFMPAGHVAMKNVMFAPLVIDGVTRGVMGLANKPDDFTDDDAEIAAALGEFAAIALYNSYNLDTLQHTIKRLEHALEEIKKLHGIIPICANCKKIRNDEGYWEQVEAYFKEREDIDFSHGLCPECAKKLYPEAFDEMEEE